MRGDLEGYRAKLSERFIIKDRGILGADGLREMRILNTVITCHPAKPGCLEMLTYEADQRHADLLMTAYGLTASRKTKATPLDKAAFLARHPLAGPLLDEKRRVEFRSNCMRCLYFAPDRPGTRFTAKEISRAMASPTVHADETLKALSRYLAGHLRVPWRYPRQEWLGKVWRLTDSRPALDGKTPHELRMEHKFGRPVAPWGQKVWWMSVKKHVTCISAESRWQEGIFSGNPRRWSWRE